MVSHLTFLALEALLPAVVLVVVTGLLLRFAWKERRGQRVAARELASAGAERSSLCPARHFTAVALGQLPRLLAHRSLRWWVIVVYRADAALQLPHHGLR